MATEHKIRAMRRLTEKLQTLVGPRRSGQDINIITDEQVSELFGSVIAVEDYIDPEKGLILMDLYSLLEEQVVNEYNNPVSGKSIRARLEIRVTARPLIEHLEDVKFIES